MPTRRDWTREELILAMNLYCRLPFGKMHKGTPEIIELAAALGRTPSSVAMKLSNLASLDPAHQKRGVKGLSGASAADRRIWDEFHADWTRLAVESEQLRDQYLPHNQPELASVRGKSTADDPTAPTYAGETEASRTVNVRLAQSFFRRTVLTGFESRCCISGIPIAELLIASHIVPWGRSPEHRANPRNGLCLSRLHDGAFDRGLITLDEEFRLVLSRELTDHVENAVLGAAFKAYEGKPIALPSRFHPDAKLLESHREMVFRG